MKGAANLSKRCALCRQVIPTNYLLNPELLDPEELVAKPDDVTDRYAWYYEGRNGWWQYDKRTSYELENARLANNKTAELLIAGFLYIVDFENMVQTRRNDPHRRRRIKRDVVNIPDKKGVAGIRFPQLLTDSEQIDSGGSTVIGWENPRDVEQDLNTDSVQIQTERRFTSTGQPSRGNLQLESTEGQRDNLELSASSSTCTNRQMAAEVDTAELSSTSSSSPSLDPDTLSSSFQALQVEGGRVNVHQHRQVRRHKFLTNDRIRLLDCDVLSSSDDETV